MRPGRRAARTLGWGLALLAVLGLWQAWSNGGLWRRAYPYLPRQVQGLPYKLRAALPRSRHTPVPLPSAPVVGQTALVSPVAARPQTTPTSPVSPVSPTASASRPTLVPPASASPGAFGDRKAADSADSTPTTAMLPLPASVRLTGLTHAYQTWNNCGPATAGMALSAFGPAPDQSQIARVLKPDPDDKNVSPEELVAFIRSGGTLGARWRQGGDLHVLKTLLAAGLPVIVETWFIPEPGDEMGHYRVLMGYEDPPGLPEGAGWFLAFDSYLGPDRKLKYGDFDAEWRVFNYGFTAVYPVERASEVDGILGPLADDRSMALAALARAQKDISPQGYSDAYGWFNLGTSLLAVGDPPGAADAFDRARAAGLPWRMLWYQFGPFEAYAATGRWQDVTALAEANLRNAANLEESHYWLGRAAASNGDDTAALASYDRALRFNPGFTPAAMARAAMLGATPAP